MTRRTQNGRTIDYRQDPAHREDAASVGHGDRAIPPTLMPFIEGCEAMLPADLADEGRVRVGLFLFLLGAIDRYWQRSALDDQRFPSVSTALLQRYGVDSSAAMTLASALPQIRETPDGGATMLEGAELMDVWMETHDADSLLRVGELTLRWRERAFETGGT